MTTSRASLTRLLLVCVLLALVPSFSSAGAVLERIRRTESVTIAYRESSIPFSYYVSDSHPVGYSIDICTRLVEAIRRSLQLSKLSVSYVKVSPADRIEAIQSGRADLECGSTTNTFLRRDAAAFTLPHFISGARFLVPANSTAVELGDFWGKSLATTKGTTAAQTVKAMNDAYLLGITVVEVVDHGQAFALLSAGKVSGFAMDEVLLVGLQANSRSPSDFKVTGKYLTIEPYAIMLNRDDAEFKRLIDSEMKRLVKDGELNTLYEKWFMKPIPPKGVPLNIRMNHLLRDMWKQPNDWLLQTR